jgi:hypothetical protein
LREVRGELQRLKEKAALSKWTARRGVRKEVEQMGKMMVYHGSYTTVSKRIVLGRTLQMKSDILR